MDPITRAARAFLAEAEAFWRAEPGRILPMIAGPPSRGEIVKALRLEELAPKNRRPLFLYEAPFTERRAYFDGLTEAIRQDYAALRGGVASEGVTLPPFPVSEQGPQESPGAMERAVVAGERVAGLLGDLFEGLCLALVPRQVADPAGWRESIATLHRVRWSARVRLAVFSPPAGPLQDTLGSRGAHLRIDEDELRDFLRSLSPAANDASLRGLY